MPVRQRVCVEIGQAEPVLDHPHRVVGLDHLDLFVGGFVSPDSAVRDQRLVRGIACVDGQAQVNTRQVLDLCHGGVHRRRGVELVVDRAHHLDSTYSGIEGERAVSGRIALGIEQLIQIGGCEADHTRIDICLAECVRAATR